MSIRRALTAALLAMACAPRFGFVRVFDAETGRPLERARVTTDRSDIIATTDSLGWCPYPQGAVRGATIAVEGAGLIALRRPVAGAESRGETLLLRAYPDLPRVVRCEVADSVTGNLLLGAVVGVVGDTGTARDRADGSFWFESFAAGPVLLAASYEGCAPETLTVLARGGETTAVQFRLRDTSNAGNVTGTVCDDSTGEFLEGARLTVEGTSLGGLSRDDGTFLIARVPIGEYVLVCERSGYETKRVQFPLVRGWSVVVDVRISPLP